MPEIRFPLPIEAPLDRGQSMASVPSPANQDFGMVLAQARSGRDVSDARIIVRQGDTLTRILQGFMARRGTPVDDRQALQLSRQVAAANAIANPNMIYSGQVLDLSSVASATQYSSAAPAERPEEQAARMEKPVAEKTWAQPQTASSQLAYRTATQRPAANPVLERTLQRAVDKGYIPPSERAAVSQRVMDLARTYNFAPDDFARITLMESDGMNPRATNGNCHGIIQFCEGANRGAASVDMAGRARSIQNMSVLKQLDLVEKYLQDTGLKPNGPRATLDDLYLTVLTPAARAERAQNGALNVAGPQAAVLHVQGDRANPITRNSLTQGLLRNALERLSGYMTAPQTATANGARQRIAVAGGESLPLQQDIKTTLAANATRSEGQVSN